MRRGKMSKSITKAFFLFILVVFFLSFFSQTLTTNDRIPRTEEKIEQALKSKNLSQDVEKKNQKQEQTKATDEMMQFAVGAHVLGFGKDNVLIASADHALRVEFVDAQPVSPVDETILYDYDCALTSNKRESRISRDSPQAAMPLDRVSYHDLWEGVTLTYEKHAGSIVKSTYIVQPTHTKSVDSAVITNQNPVDQIRLRYNVPVHVDKSGNLVLCFETGQMIESRPVAWQEIAGHRIPVEVSFRSLNAREAGFKVGTYDPRFPLVIDPVLSWNTFMGSSINDGGYSIAVDINGNIYVTGDSSKTWGSPIHPFSGNSDAFVAKLNCYGVRLWNTFLGSDQTDAGTAIAVDTSGNVYVAGFSFGTWGMPLRPHSGSYDGFVAKLNSNGILQWNTFLGGADGDDCVGITLDTSGNILLTGRSDTTWGMPINPHSGTSDAFVAKLNNSGGLQWNTFMGTMDGTIGIDIAVDKIGSVYVVGGSNSSWGTPIHAFSGKGDAFVAKLELTGIPIWHTFMGSAEQDAGTAIAVDSSGNIYVSGSSSAAWGTPINDFAANGDTFVAKLSNTGSLQWNTFMGSAAGDPSYDIALDANESLYVLGTSLASWGMPIHSYSGDRDVFVTKLSNTGSLQWNTFMGSANEDEGQGIAVDRNGNIYVAGYSETTWGVPINPFEDFFDAFVAKITASNIYVFDGHDFNSNGSSDVSVWRPSNGRWYIKDVGSFNWGQSGDIPANGDYDGDGTTDVAVWRPSNGRWYIKGIGGAFWGTYGDIPVPGDYDGDGFTDIAVWRPIDGKWYIKDIGTYAWGRTGDIPVPGDYDGDGSTDIAVWRPSDGLWYTFGIGGTHWGTLGDVPLASDYDGDGITDIAVWRPSNGRWYIYGIGIHAWGILTDIPVPGDYDGDGYTDIAVWRPSNGRWYIKGMTGAIWGVAGDIPVVR
jgi:hypothetical protein